MSDLISTDITAHCLFEQSGTFKKEFQKLGITAYDYDILNDFEETDFQIDLFDEISKATKNEKTIFDNIKSEDITIAFFPCTMFQENNALWFSGEAYQLKKYSLSEKLNSCICRHEKLHLFYTRLCQLAKIYADRSLRLVIENPATTPHYLTTYWLPCTFVDKDRTLNGDYFKKPTQFWFIGFEPKNNFLFEPIEYVETKKINHVTKAKSGINRTVERSLIHPQYASRFIKQYII